MKINSFSARNVHGHLNYEIKFFPELTFLIGINGSGKTSALKLILGLISPVYSYLNQISFTYAELVCSSNSNEQDILIRADHVEEGGFRMTVKTSNQDSMSRSFHRSLTRVEKSYSMEDVTLKEQAHKEQFDSSEITRIIRELATPKFLGLDRRIYEGRSIDSVSRGKRHPYSHPREKRYFDIYQGLSAIDNSLEDVQELIYDYFRRIAYQQPRISEDFKTKIFQSSFQFMEESSIDILPSDRTLIMEKKQKVSEAIRSLDLRYLDSYVNNFFNKMEALIVANNKLKASESNDPFSDEQMVLVRKWFNNSSQLRRIDSIINYSQDYQVKITELRAPMKRLEEIASKFFKEGKKSLQVADDGEIKVKLSNGKITSVFELSSGEKQIIIMIAHLIFEEDQKPSGVFIIDEPELSLHIAWQEIFIDSIQQASPKTQFILATHSPSIIAKVDNEKYCQDLNKLNY